MRFSLAIRVPLYSQCNVIIRVETEQTAKSKHEYTS